MFFALMVVDAERNDAGTILIGALDVMVDIKSRH